MTKKTQKTLKIRQNIAKFDDFLFKFIHFPQIGKVLVWVCFILSFIWHANIFDTIITTILWSFGGKELNPLMDFLLKKDIIWFWIFKIIHIPIVSFIVMKFNREKPIKISLLLGALVYYCLILWYISIFSYNLGIYLRRL